MAITPSGMERPCGELCAHIRKRFGVGLDDDTNLDAHTRSALQEIRGGFQRSIHRLAEELYAGSEHFVLELIQNADDNRYADGATPALHITVAAESLRFHNNELGFSETDVLSLCNIGQSTKQASDPRYIGNKGIGWKSVFKISPVPQVHSRHYHLGFNSNDASGLGYICPEPINSPEGWDENNGTAIILPLTATGAETAIRDFEFAMGRMQPLLLLFLHQLELIQITLTGGATRSLSRRSDKDDARVVLLEEQQHEHVSCQRFLVVTRRLAPAVTRGNATVSSTELTVAFPLPEAAQNIRLPFMDVFAFLPLRSYGLTFVLQADWVVPSSRESIDASSAWNQWLRDETPALFLDAAEQLLARAVSTTDTPHRVHLTNLLLQLVPLHASEFFQPLAEECCRLLRSCECVPTREGGMCCPREAVLPSTGEVDGLTAADEQIAQTTDNLIQNVGLKYAVSGLQISEELGTVLGLQYLNATLLTTLLTELSSCWREASQVDAKWLVWALQQIRRDPHSSKSSVLSALRRLRILPLRNGRLACIQPCGRSEEQGATCGPGAIFELGRGIELTAEEEELSTLFSNVQLLDASFTAELASSRDASSLLVQLGVLQLLPDDFVRSHVVNALANNQTPSPELPVLFCLARRLAPHTRSLRGNALARCLVDARAQLLASNGSTCRLGENLALHLSHELEPKLSFVPEEPPADWLVVSRAYLQAEADVASLKSLLLTLGVADFPAIVPADADDGERDWTSPSCEALLAALCAASDRKRLKQFATTLTERWPVLCRHATRGTAPSSSPSDFILSLRRHAWLAGSDNELHAPAELWLRSRELEDILSESGVVWATASLSDDLACALGVRTCLNAETAIALLASWAAEPSFTTTLDQMAAMLRWLKPIVEADESVRVILRGARCIWVPNRSEIEWVPKKGRRVPSGRVAGRFYTPRECVREDPTSLIDSLKPTVTEEVVELAASAGIRCLSVYYGMHRLDGAFEALGVGYEPELEHLVAILTAASETGEPCATSLTAVYRIFGNWAFADQWQRRDLDEINEGDEDPTGADAAQRDLSIGDQIAHAVGDAAVFPMANGGWAPLSDVYFFTHASLVEDSAVSWSALANVHALECHPPGPPYDSNRMRQLQKSEQLPENFVKNLEVNLLTFFSSVLQLHPITHFLRQAVSATDERLAPLTSSLRVCAAAAVLQRWSTSSLARLPHQQEALQAALTSLKLYHTTAIMIHDELMAPSGVLLERTSGTATQVLLRTDNGVAELFLTSAATPRSFVQELVKLLREPAQRAEAAMVILPLLEAVWSWDGIHGTVPAEKLHNAVCGTDHGLGDMPMLSASELWLVWDASPLVEDLAAQVEALNAPSAVDDSEDDLEGAMAYELQRLAGEEEVAIDMGVLGSSALEIDPALAASLSSLKELRISQKAAPQTAVVFSSAGLRCSGAGRSGDGGASCGSGWMDRVQHEGGHASVGDCLADEHIGGGSNGGCGCSSRGDSSTERMVHDARSVGAALEFPGRIGVDAWEALCVQPAVVKDLLSSSSAQQGTGRWGEKLVASHLKATLESADVAWMNEEEESGLPYDILVTEHCAAQGFSRDSYVEVKATTSSDKPLFEMSVAELDFARKHGAAYSLYRVFSAGDGDARVLKLHNVARSLGNGGLLLFAGAAGAVA